MAKCQNCGTAMSCGCQRRTSTDGKTIGCTKCITNPSQINKGGTRYTNLKNTTTGTDPVINSAILNKQD
jgi:hypothetical protein